MPPSPKKRFPTPNRHIGKVMKITRTLFLLGIFTLVSALTLTAADFQASTGGPPPPDSLSDALRSMIQSEAVVAKGPDGKTIAEFWMRTAPFEGEPSAGFGIRFTTIPPGSLLGVVRFPDEGSDFREQHIEPGLYTMRFSLHPEDGNHMGVAASRDFAALIKAEADKEPAKNLAFEPLTKLSISSTGNTHPTIMRVQFPDGDETGHVWQDDMEHWLVDLAVADEVMGVVIHGHSEE